MRGQARSNVGAQTLMSLLDSKRQYEASVEDDRPRVYINGVWVDPITRRELRRYRNGHVATVRLDTAINILNKFNLSLEDLHGHHS